jgi:hypothetical protein
VAEFEQAQGADDKPGEVRNWAALYAWDDAGALTLNIFPVGKDAHGRHLITRDEAAAMARIYCDIYDPATAVAAVASRFGFISQADMRRDPRLAKLALRKMQGEDIKATDIPGNREHLLLYGQDRDGHEAIRVYAVRWTESSAGAAPRRLYTERADLNEEMNAQLARGDPGPIHAFRPLYTAPLLASVRGVPLETARLRARVEAKLHYEEMRHRGLAMMTLEQASEGAEDAR